MKKTTRIILALLLALVGLLGIATPAFAVDPPDLTFNLVQVEAYRHCFELDDQGFLITLRAERTQCTICYLMFRKADIHIKACLLKK